MGNICEAIGVTRKDATAFGNQTPTGNSARDSNSASVEVVETPPTPSPKDSIGSGESKSPVVTTKKRAESVDTNTAEIKMAFAKKQSDEAAAAAAVEVLTGPRLRLLPHQHTLFCERKQRVCTAVGQQQEMEVVKLEGFKDVPSFSWIRIKPENIDKFNENAEEGTDLSSFCEVIEQKQTHAEGERELGELEYSLSREDVGHFLGVRFESTPALVEEGSESAQVVHKYITLLKHGVVLPGPPRLTDFSVTGSMQVGTLAVAEVSYIGGHEGPTEYWWMRISPEGKRTQVTEPRPIPYTPAATFNPLVTAADAAPVAAGSAQSDDGAAAADSADSAAAVAGTVGAETGDAEATTATEDSTAATTGEATTANAAQLSPAEGEQLDPRYYKLTEADLGCCLKAKCRPTRSDGVQGEIFTSTSSEEVVA